MSTDHEVSGDFGEQLALEAVPVEGSMCLDNRSGTIGCVTRVRVEPRRTWITVRRHGSETDMPLDQWQLYWSPCRPDGTLL